MVGYLEVWFTEKMPELSFSSDKSKQNIFKGQLISKGPQFFQKTQQKQFDLGYCSSVRSIFLFVCFFEELKTPKDPFEINWPLASIEI